MIEKTIVDFVRYLNDNGYRISTSKILLFINILNNEDISFVNYDDIIGIMKSVFCTNKYEYDNIENFFQYFLKSHEEINLIRNKINKKEKEIDSLSVDKIKLEKEIEEFVEKSKEEIGRLDKDIKRETENILKQMGDKSILSKKDISFLQKNNEKLRKINFSKSNKKNHNLLLDDELHKIKEKDFKKLLEEITELSKKEISKNNLENFNFLNNYFGIVKKLSESKSKQKVLVERKINKAIEPFKNKQKEIEDSIKKQESEKQKIQNKINNLLSEINNNTNSINKLSKKIEKEKSVNHRSIFLGGKNYISTTTKEYEKILEKNFKQLSDDDKKKIFYYINKNILKFKTKLSRKVNTSEKLNVDIGETIKYACKTGGLPLEIIYEKPKLSKTNLVLILDVSGSCKEASELMLSFMYLLQDVFGGGCKTFAFVNSLYDISDIMKSSDINTSIENVLNMIPRKGVYSNYYIPLKSLWEDERKYINKDSFVIFIGDARNNKNPDGIKYLRNICIKAKKSYWLNTEERSKWGYQDSLAYRYGRHVKMYEVLSSLDIINFLNNFK